MGVRKTGGGVGTNQYAVRGRAKIITTDILDTPSVSTALVNDTGTDRRRCGEVWGTNCQAWVSPPEYAHYDHPGHSAKRDYIRRADPDPIILAGLARDQVPWVRRMVAESPNISPGLLDLLSRDKDRWVRRGTAMNPNASPGLLDTLARDQEAWVRGGVAMNPKTSPGLLDTLARDEDILVRSGVAGNPYASPDTLKRLVFGKDQQVVEAALSNPSLPDTVRAIILLDR